MVSRKPWLGLSMAAYGPWFWPCLILCWNYSSPTIVLLPSRAPVTSWDAVPEESAWDHAPGETWAVEPRLLPTSTSSSPTSSSPTSTPAAPSTDAPPDHW